MPYHVALHVGGTFSGSSASAWDLDEPELRKRFIVPREEGREVWLQGDVFPWPDSKMTIFKGPATSEIEDYTSALGPGAYAMTGVLMDVTDDFITGPPGKQIPDREDDPTTDAVFVVHGKDTARREEIARFLETVVGGGTSVIILQEELNRGRTLLEKFEASASRAQFAVVIFTADDEARPRGSEVWELRARQNVIFELGFFAGSIGRDHVAVLFETGIEKPSDIDGLVHIPLDDAEGWKLRLTRELRAAGVDADLNRLDPS